MSCPTRPPARSDGIGGNANAGAGRQHPLAMIHSHPEAN
jgi:hypothetical protein